jgi:hypothetical protein
MQTMRAGAAPARGSRPRSRGASRLLAAVLFGWVLLMGGSSRAITRCQVLTRAQSWVDAKVPYSQSSYFKNTYGSYRQDCSGYVSMAWDLSSSHVASTLPQVSHKLASFNDLQPGDAVNHTCCHVMLFKKWITVGVSYKSYEEQNWGTVANTYTWTVASAKAQGYASYRRNNIKDRSCDGNKLIAEDCGVTNCAASSKVCVDDSLGARCAATACVSGGKVDGAHDVCLADGRIARCTAEGQLTNERACPAGQTCGKSGASVACAVTSNGPDSGVGAPDSGAGSPEQDSGAATRQDGGARFEAGAGSPEASNEMEGGCSMAPSAASAAGFAPLLLLCAAGVWSQRSRRRFQDKGSGQNKLASYGR